MSRYTKALILAIIVCGEHKEAAARIMAMADDPEIDVMYDAALAARGWIT